MAAQVYRDSNQTDIEPGDMLKFDRDGKFFHYAIYIGEGKVVHQTKDAGVLKEELKDVISGSRFYIDCDLDLEIRPKRRTQIVKDALSKVGRKGYDLFSSNCEHFATWCRYGEARCRQIGQKLMDGAIYLSTSGSCRSGFSGSGSSGSGSSGSGSLTVVSSCSGCCKAKTQ